MLDVSSISISSPDFTEALGVRYPNPLPSASPTVIRAGVSRLPQIRDRRDKLQHALQVLHEMLYLAECPEDFLAIAGLIGEVRRELTQLDS